MQHTPNDPAHVKPYCPSQLTPAQYDLELYADHWEQQEIDRAEYLADLEAEESAERLQQLEVDRAAEPYFNIIPLNPESAA
jgi:hypothetical protein